MTAPTPAQLHHLAARARDGVALPAEHDALANGITAMAARLVTLEAVCESNKRAYKGAVQAAWTAEAAIERVRAAVHVADHDDVTDWQRGYRACSQRARAALDQAQQPTTTETGPAVTIHACPGPDDNGISPCCKRPPFEFRSERLTRDPEAVTCPGPQQQPTA